MVKGASGNLQKEKIINKRKHAGRRPIGIKYFEARMVYRLPKTRGQIHIKKGTFVRLHKKITATNLNPGDYLFVKKRKSFLTSSILFLLELLRFPQEIASVLTLRQRRKIERTLNRSIFPEDP